MRPPRLMAASNFQPCARGLPAGPSRARQGLNLGHVPVGAGFGQPAGWAGSNQGRKVLCCAAPVDEDPDFPAAWGTTLASPGLMEKGRCRRSRPKRSVARLCNGITANFRPRSATTWSLALAKRRRPRLLLSRNENERVPAGAPVRGLQSCCRPPLRGKSSRDQANHCAAPHPFPRPSGRHRPCRGCARDGTIARSAAGLRDVNVCR